MNIEQNSTNVLTYMVGWHCSCSLYAQRYDFLQNIKVFFYISLLPVVVE